MVKYKLLKKRTHLEAGVPLASGGHPARYQKAGGGDLRVSRHCRGGAPIRGDLGQSQEGVAHRGGSEPLANERETGSKLGKRRAQVRRFI